MGFQVFLIFLSCIFCPAFSFLPTPIDLEGCTSYQEDLGACFRGTEFSDTNPSLAVNQIQGFFLMSTEDVCSKSALYTQLLKCVSDAAAACTTDDQIKSLLVSGSSYEKALKTFCESETGINTTCFSNSQSGYGMCTETKIQSRNLTLENVNASFTDWRNNICSYGEVFIECLGENEALATCLDTRTLLLQLWNYIVRPDACVADDAFSNRSSLIIVLLASIISFINFHS